MKKKSALRWVKYLFLFILGCIITGSILRSLKPYPQRHPQNTSDREWADRSYGYAPHPDDYKGPVIQVYAARTRGSKKMVAVHTWIAVKREGEGTYIISQIKSWHLRRRGTALDIGPGVPDRDWAGNEPQLLLDLRGDEAAGLIDHVEEAIEEYPWQDRYIAWPGPNSNTFTSWVGLQVPELKLDLPATAIGKDWRPLSEVVGTSTSGTGFQASLYGLFGLTVGFEEGLEINILGMSIEFDIFDLAIELPGIGRVG